MQLFHVYFPCQNLMMSSAMACFVSSDSAFNALAGWNAGPPVPFPLGHPKNASDTSFLDGSAPASNTLSLCWMKVIILSMLTGMSSQLNTSINNSPKILVVSFTDKNCHQNIVETAKSETSFIKSQAKANSPKLCHMHKISQS